MTSTADEAPGGRGAGPIAPYRATWPRLNDQVWIRYPPSANRFRRRTAVVACVLAAMTCLLAAIAWVVRVPGPNSWGSNWLDRYDLGSYPDAPGKAAMAGLAIVLSAPFYLPAVLWLVARSRGRAGAVGLLVDDGEQGVRPKGRATPVVTRSDCTWGHVLAADGPAVVLLAARGDESSRVVTVKDRRTAQEVTYRPGDPGQPAGTFRFAVLLHRERSLSRFFYSILFFAVALLIFGFLNVGIAVAFIYFASPLIAVVAPWAFFVAALRSYVAAALVVDEQGLQIGRDTRIPYVEITSTTLDRGALRIHSRINVPHDMTIRAWPGTDWPELEMIKAAVDAGIQRGGGNG
jgi:hypothetical protein